MKPSLVGVINSSALEAVTFNTEFSGKLLKNFTLTGLSAVAAWKSPTNATVSPMLILPAIPLTDA